MYNSIFISSLVRFWEFINREYKRSFLKKIVDSFSRAWKYLSKGSRFKSIFTSREYLIEKSSIYKGYASFMKLVNRGLNELRAYIEKNADSSLIHKNVSKLFSTKVEVFRTFFVFTLSFGLALVVNNIIRGYYSGRSYFVIAALVFVSLVGISLKDGYKDIFKNSIVWRIIYSIFSTEEELSHGD